MSGSSVSLIGTCLDERAVLELAPGLRALGVDCGPRVAGVADFGRILVDAAAVAATACEALPEGCDAEVADVGAADELGAAVLPGAVAARWWWTRCAGGALRLF